MESWRSIFRTALVPQLTTGMLETLRDALVSDDSRLIQGATTSPPPQQCVQEWPVEAACLIGYCGWQGEGLGTVAEVEQFFARICFAIDERLGKPAECRHLLNWFDDTPRDEMRRLLLEEVGLALADRQEVRPDLIVA